MSKKRTPPYIYHTIKNTTISKALEHPTTTITATKVVFIVHVGGTMHDGLKRLDLYYFYYLENINYQDSS
jgi:hypothetical protein